MSYLLYYILLYESNDKSLHKPEAPGNLEKKKSLEFERENPHKEIVIIKKSEVKMLYTYELQHSRSLHTIL